MPTGEWFIDGERVPNQWVASRDPSYVPFQSLGPYSNLVYPQGANYPRLDYWAPPQDGNVMPENTFGSYAWEFSNGNMYPIGHPWFWDHHYMWGYPGYARRQFWRS
ncbi:hypothetical protein CERZMDRAFT_92963 [Cercospora zeae-maydis SCOH1-5]|uniref:Uncharacterized protein n=1 Tax=Cercospora zeae-maydis SCOH1-5 TaxID=717836 RepID=A0A6A6FUF3_9PEZI|nr:hypothetical protein CERZMDRAFT_92963 [Cercospora zeae-maydis SCOH1-5]